MFFFLTHFTLIKNELKLKLERETRHNVRNIKQTQYIYITYNYKWIIFDWNAFENFLLCFTHKMHVRDDNLCVREWDFSIMYIYFFKRVSCPDWFCFLENTNYIRMHWIRFENCLLIFGLKLQQTFQ